MTLNEFSHSDSPLDSFISKPPNKHSNSVYQISDFSISEIISLLEKYHLKIKVLSPEQAICGSYWGDSEAGLIENTLYVRKDTPIHSLLHEACHYICMDETRRVAWLQEKQLLDSNNQPNYKLRTL